MTAPGTARPRGANPQVLLMVMLACLPGGSALIFFFGWGVAFNLVWLPLLAVTLEAAMLKARARPLSQLRDCTALVTAVLLALSLPATAPWWLGAAGAFVAIGIAKQVHGANGRTVLNPAMLAYAVLLLAFPLQMTRWLLPEGAGVATPSFTDALMIFLGRDPDAGIDAFTGATMLDSFRQEHGGRLFAEFMTASNVAGRWAGLGWEWINTGFLMGGAYLVYRRIITWHVPVSLLGAVAVWALLFHDGGSSASHGSPLFHLFSGATMLGAFFIATDPATSPATVRGKLLYGAFIGSLVFAFRAWSSYPDGIAFAVLLGNLTAPLLDAYARPGTTFRFSADKSWTFTLAVIAAAGFVAVGAEVVANLQRADVERAALSAVMPASLHDNDLGAASFTIDPADATSPFTEVELLGLSTSRNAYRATLNGSPSGIVLPLTAPEGYNGTIELLVGIDKDGTITGVRVIQHSETRGLGDVLEVDASNWILGFDNRSLANTDEVLWAVKKDGGDFDQFTGATITPRATVEAVHNALLFFAANRDTLLAASP
jgi:electron transport complex protein RnfD